MVGIVATAAHVAIAWILIELASCDPYLANLLGACTAFTVSFGGNAAFTFHTGSKLWKCACRYLLVSLFSLAMTSAVLLFVEQAGLPTYVYVLGVLVIVPPSTFLLAKLWAFGPT